MYTLLIKAMLHIHGQMFIQFHIEIDLLHKVYTLSSIFFLVLSKFYFLWTVGPEGTFFALVNVG